MKEKLRYYAKQIKNARNLLPKILFCQNEYSNKQYQPTKKLNIALVGCGDIGLKNAIALQKSDLCQLTTVFDVNYELANDIKKRFNVTIADNFEAILADANIDAAILAVPHHLHAPLAIQGLRANKNIILEKPLARNFDEASSILDVEKVSQAHLSVCFPLRYKYSFYQAKRWLKENLLGKLQAIHVRVHLKRDINYWQGGFSGRNKSDWRTKRETAGGGVLIMNAIHCLEALEWLFEKQLESIQGCVAFPSSANNIAATEMDIENNATASFRLGDVVGNLYATTHWPLSPEEEISLIGEKGIISIGNTLTLQLNAPRNRYKAHRIYRFIEMPVFNERTAFYNEYANALLSNQLPPVNALGSSHVQAVVDEIYKSSGVV